MGLHASNRDAPNARYISTLSLLSLSTVIEENVAEGECIKRTTAPSARM